MPVFEPGKAPWGDTDAEFDRYWERARAENPPGKCHALVANGKPLNNAGEVLMRRAVPPPDPPSIARQRADLRDIEGQLLSLTSDGVLEDDYSEESYP